MELLFDSNNHVVVKDGKPVYKHSDGKEIPFDAPSAVTSIAELNNEAKGHRLKAKEFESQVKAFDGLDVKKAREALDIVKNLDDKKLVDAGKIETIKQQMIDDFEVTKRGIIKNFEEEKELLTGDLDKSNGYIHNMMVESEFFKNPLFNGKDQKTTMTADVAYSVFKDHFSIDTSGEKPRVVAKLDGEEVLSRENPGKPATFHEAMDKIWEKYPNRTRYEAQNNGGGGGGNFDRNNKQEFRNPTERIAAGIRARQQNR